MTDYDNTNRGVLFRNDRQETDRHPTHTGSINIEGREYWLSAWVKESKNGKKFFSLSVKAKDDLPKTEGPAVGMASTDIDSDIPF